VNTQISAVKSQKQYQHQQYEEWLQEQQAKQQAEDRQQVTDQIRQQDPDVAKQLETLPDKDFWDIVQKFGSSISVAGSGTELMVDEGSSFAKVAIEEGSDLEKFTKVVKGIGYAGDAIAIGADIVKGFQSGGDAGDIALNVISDSAYDAIAFGVNFIPVVGTALSFGLGMADLVSGGALSRGLGDFIKSWF
jgi:hypothetical protein